MSNTANARVTALTYADEILKAVAVDPQGGNFKQDVVSDTGKVITHRTSFAVGMASDFWHWKYRTKFGKPVPQWVSIEHPYRRTLLCRVAINHGSELPVHPPLAGKRS